MSKKRNIKFSWFSSFKSLIQFHDRDNTFIECYCWYLFTMNTVLASIAVTHAVLRQSCVGSKHIPLQDFKLRIFKRNLFFFTYTRIEKKYVDIAFYLLVS
jgi:hypothetical protein